MSNRIKELAKQAHEETYEALSPVTSKEELFEEFFNARFAELIIQQCCALTKQYSNDHCSIRLTKDYFDLPQDEE